MRSIRSESHGPTHTEKLLGEVLDVDLHKDRALRFHSQPDIGALHKYRPRFRAFRFWTDFKGMRQTKTDCF